jgi:hypothetical protein
MSEGGNREVRETVARMEGSTRTGGRVVATTVLVLAVVATQAGCSGTALTSPTRQSLESREFGHSAMARGPMLVVVQGNPYPIANEELEARVLDEMRQAMTWTATPGLTADPAAAPTPSLRVVMTFNAGIIDANVQCLGGSQGGGPLEDGAVQVTASFCGSSDMISNTSGSIGKSPGINDPAFASLISQVTNDLFPYRGLAPGLGIGVGGGFGVGSGGFSGGGIGVGIGF